MSPNEADKDALRARRAIPSVDEVLGSPAIAAARSRSPRFPWTRAVREVIDACRREGLRGVPAERGAVREVIVARVLGAVDRLQKAGMGRVLNGTGVILHTNLGRAVSGEAVREAVAEALSHYQGLEVDLETGERGARAEVLTDLIRMACGAEAAMVVNNNAAAVVLVVDTFSPPGRVIVSRGELVEIGGSFRLPDILAKAAGEVIEVGTTNRTYARDYAAVVRSGDVILRAHPSNYEIQGFTHEATLADLVAIGQEQGCTVVYDLGSGSLFDFAAAGYEGEEVVADAVASGVHCVTMSGDKLLGGVQAGILVGRADVLDRMKKNPLRRALRVDKITIAALQALFREYLFAPDPENRVPVLAQATVGRQDLERRGRAVIDALGTTDGIALDLVDDDAAVGGGSFACKQVPSVAIALRCATDKEARALTRLLRAQSIPVLSRIRGREVRINLRTILPYEDGDLIEAMRGTLANSVGLA